MVLVEILIHVHDTLNLSDWFNFLHLSLVSHSCDIAVFSSLNLFLCCGHLPRVLYSGYHLLGFGPKLICFLLLFGYILYSQWLWIFTKKY